MNFYLQIIVKKACPIKAAGSFVLLPNVCIDAYGDRLPLYHRISLLIAMRAGDDQRLSATTRPRFLEIDYDSEGLVLLVDSCFHGLVPLFVSCLFLFVLVRLQVREQIDRAFLLRRLRLRGVTDGDRAIDW